MFSAQTATFTLYNIKSLVFITEVESVYSAVRTESYNTDTFRLSRVSDTVSSSEYIVSNVTYLLQGAESFLRS